MPFLKYERFVYTSSAALTLTLAPREMNSFFFVEKSIFALHVYTSRHFFFQKKTVAPTEKSYYSFVTGILRCASRNISSLRRATTPSHLNVSSFFTWYGAALSRRMIAGMTPFVLTSSANYRLYSASVHVKTFLCNREKLKKSTA